ncbi:hypothetical protein BW892_30100, partial [Bacillus cereus]
LKLTDLKEQYNVQTPTDAYVLYNVLTLRQTPAEVMEKLKKIAEESAAAIFEKMGKMYGSSDSEGLIGLKPKVFTYSKLYALGKERFGVEFESDMADVLGQQTDVEFDYRQKTVE